MIQDRISKHALKGLIISSIGVLGALCYIILQGS